MKTKKLSPFTLSIALLLIGVLSSCATKFPVSFHLQGDKSDGAKMSVTQNFAGHEITFRKSGFIGSRDIESYRSFQDPKTGTYGVGFYLKPGAKNRYQASTAENIGKLILPIANGKPCEIFEIDKSYSHGIICIYSGLTKEDLDMISEVYDPHEKEKERLDYNKAEKNRKVKELQ